MVASAAFYRVGSAPVLVELGGGARTSGRNNALPFKQNGLGETPERFASVLQAASNRGSADPDQI